MLVSPNKTGKTEVGVAEVVCHAIGRRPYLSEDDPLYWVTNSLGNRIRVPNKGRIVCVDEKLIQEEMVPFLQKWIPKEMVPQGWDKHYSKKFGIVEIWVDGDPQKVSTIGLKTWNQESQSHSGVESDYCMFNEVPTDQTVFAEEVRGMTHTHGRYWMCFTPVIEQEWIYEKCNTVDDDMEVITYPAEACEFMTLPKIEQMKKDYPKDEWEPRIYGKFIQLQGRMYKNFTMEMNVIDPFKIDPTWPSFAAIDDHDSAPTACIVAVIDPRDERWYFVDEYYQRGSIKDHGKPIREMLSRWNVREPFPLIDPHTTSLRQRGSGADLELLWAEALGRCVTPARSGRVTAGGGDTPEDRYRWQKLNDLFETKTMNVPVNGKIQEVQVPGAFVFRTCQNLIRQLVARQYRYTVEEGKPDIPKTQENHATDCAEYLAEWGIDSRYYEEVENEPVRHRRGEGSNSYAA